jgi:large exoprotein involved in heme utilization and adhesion
LFTNGSNLFADNDGTRNAGNITLEALESIILKNVSQIGSNTAGQGNAGNIDIITKSVSIEDDSTINASTLDEGDAGSIFIKATDSISFDNISGILSNVDPGAIGNAGDIQLEANSISFTNGSALSASILGTGNAGNITVDTNFLTLDKNSVISTFNIPLQSLETNLSGGNIALTIADNLILRNNSRITALAGANANGGNVTIDANDGVILAFPNQNNDITANASQGNGGNIDITTQAIFGLEERLSTPPNTTNDIDASSEFGLQGDFSLNTPDVDPTSGLLQLPASVGDASDQISQNPCERGIGSQFIITGKGGFPANPHETLNSDEVRVGLVEPLPQSLSYEERGEKRADEATGRQGEEDNHKSTVSEQLVPAMGWVFNDKGQVTLTAYDPTGNARQRFQPTKTSCSADPKEN